MSLNKSLNLSQLIKAAEKVDALRSALEGEEAEVMEHQWPLAFAASDEYGHCE